MKVVVPLLVLAAVLAACSSKSAKAPTQPRPHARAAGPTADPYLASLAYARCLRSHGVPHPNPDRKGDFNLAAADERRLRGVPKRRRDAATRACFHTLKGLDNRPLSRQGQALALAVLRELRRCIERRGYVVGDPIVRNLSMGRMMFGFERSPAPASRARYERDSHACERQVHLAKRINRIIEDDRSGF